MSFYEFKKYRDTLRKQRWANRIFDDPDEDSSQSEEKPSATEAEGEQEIKHRRWAKEEISGAPRKVGLSEPDSNSETELTSKHQDQKAGQGLEETTRKSAQGNAESQDQGAATERAEASKGSLKQRQTSGDLLETNEPSPVSGEEGQAEVSQDTDKTVHVTDKPCDECSPIWYHVLTAIVPAVWLTNIALVVWIFLARETKTTMRIPKGLVHKSSQTYVRLKALSQPAAQETRKRLHGDNPAAATSPLGKLHSHTSPSSSGTNLDNSKRTSFGPSPCLLPAPRKRNAPETRKNKPIGHERSHGDHVPGPQPCNPRPHPVGHEPPGSAQQSSDLVTEESQEDWACKRDRGKSTRPPQLVQGEAASCGARDHRVSRVDKSLFSRKTHPAVPHIVHRGGASRKNNSGDTRQDLMARGRVDDTRCDLPVTERTEDTRCDHNARDKIKDTRCEHNARGRIENTRIDRPGRGRVDDTRCDLPAMERIEEDTRGDHSTWDRIKDIRCEQNAKGTVGDTRYDRTALAKVEENRCDVNLMDDYVYFKSHNVNDTQHECRLPTARELPDVHTDRKEMAVGECSKGILTNESLYNASPSPVRLDVATQISSTDIKMPGAESKSQAVTIEGKTLCLAGKPNASELVDNTTSPNLPCFMANSKATGDTFDSEHCDLAGAKPVEYNTAGTGDYFASQETRPGRVFELPLHGQVLKTEDENKRGNAYRKRTHLENGCIESGVKGGDKRSYKADSFILEGDTLMPPPPLGYHVRRDFSNPDSSTNLCKLMKFSNAARGGEGTGLLNTNDLFASRKVVSAGELEGSTSSSGAWKSIVNPQTLLPGVAAASSPRHGARGDVDRKKRLRKLMIIGKVNCANIGHKRRKGKPDGKTQLETGRNGTYEDTKKEQKHDLVRLFRAVPIVVKAKKAPGADDKSLEDASPKSTKLCTTPGSLKSLDDASSEYYNAVDHVEKRSPQRHATRHGRHRSAVKINGGFNIKRMRLKRDSVDVRRSTKRLAKTIESRSCLNVVSAPHRRDSPEHKHGHRSIKDKMQLLPSYYMNMNSNAGISDPGPDEDGTKSLAEFEPTEGADATTQYTSLHDDSEVRLAGDIDRESSFSPPFTKDDDDVITVISDGKAELPVSVSTSSDQVGIAEGGTKPKVQGFSDSERVSGRCPEQPILDKLGDVRGDHHSNRSTVILASRDPHGAGAHDSRHKKKLKTTEHAGTKHDSNSIARKVVTAAGNKEGRRSVITKARQEKQKSHVSAGDVLKAVGSTEKCHKLTAEPQRLGKTIKCSEGHNEHLETKIKAKSGYEMYLDYIGYKDPQQQQQQGRPSSNAQVLGVRSAESDHRYSPVKAGLGSACKSEESSLMKRLVSLPETMPSQGSPKKSCQAATHYQHKTTVPDSSYSSELTQSTVKELTTSSVTPVPLKRDSAPCSPVKEGACGKRDTMKRTGSLRNEITIFPRKEKSVSPKRELSNLHERSEDTEQSLSMAKDLQPNKADEADLLSVSSEIRSTWVDSAQCGPTVEVQKDVLFRIKDSSNMGTPDIVLKCRSKKSSTDAGKAKVSENVAFRDDHEEYGSSGRSGGLNTCNGKKKSASRYKTHSRSPDGKRKKRSLKRNNNENEDVNSDKVKKLKNGDKATERKKKKKKTKVKDADDAEENDEQNTGTTEHLVYKSRSRSNESGNVTQTTLCSMTPSAVVETATSEPSLSLLVRPKRKQETRSTSSTGRLVSGSQIHASFNKQQVFKYEDFTAKSQTATSSAETTSSHSGPNMPVLSAELLLPFPAISTRTPSKTVQLGANLKVKKHVKDLQEAELGWNSAFSTDDKGTVERPKHSQKRAMVRYYIVKPKPKKFEKETGGSKLKRSAARVVNAEIEPAGSGSEMDVNSETVPPERAKPGQGKSVQFSDNIEDLEASKEEAVTDRALRRPESDSILHHPICKTLPECSKTHARLTDAETAAVVATVVPKKEEQRSPVMAAKKRRPVWLKKASKDKATPAVAKSGDTGKLSTAGAPVKKLHSSDNILKPSSRVNLHVYYPMKVTVGSPKLSNTSLTDKRRVTYRTWINSIFMAAPMNKATRKMVAKAGSPVDIKEIIEGSSVDAADHLATSKPALNGDVRAARSVPSLAPHKTAGLDLIGGKRHKCADDSRLGSHKKGKDKPRECWSPRSHSESKEHQIVLMKNCLVDVDGSISPASSTNVDAVVGFKQKTQVGRAGEHSQRTHKDKKGGRKTTHENKGKWQVLASHDSRKVSDLGKVHYCGDVVELNMINMGLTWVVQSVFNRLPFLNQRQHDPAAISAREQAGEEHVME